MSGDFEQRLRSELARIVPDAPDEPARAAEARLRAHRGRRVRNGALAVVAATVAVTALLVVPAVLRADEEGRGVTIGEETVPTEPTVTGTRYDYVCPEATETGSLVTPSQGLPGGARLARICPAGDIPWTEPVDALEVGLDELVVQVNSADPLRSGAFCTGDAGPGFTMTFQYDDGTTYGIRGDLGGCATIMVGGDQRLGAGQLVRQYAGLLGEQRSDRTPAPGAGPEPTCSAAPGSVRDDWRTILYSGEDLSLVRGVLCVFPDRGDPREVRLTDAQLTRINADVTAHATAEPPGECECVGPTVAIRGVDEWGDPYQLLHSRNLPGFEGPGYFWEPSPEGQAMLDDLVG